MLSKKTTLLASAAILAYGVTLTGGAQAFDTVDWEWNKTLTSTETVDVDIDVISPDASGLVELEKIQMNIGDVTATSDVNGIDNNPPGVGEDGIVSINEIFTIDTTFNKPGGTGNTEDALNTSVVDDPNGELDGNVDQASLTENANSFSHSVDLNVTGDIALESLEGVNDAVDLPEISSSATAVANNQSIDSSVGVNLHDAQVNFGGFAEDNDVNGSLPLAFFEGAAGATDNTHTNLLLGASLSGALGLITPGMVEATSTVTEIENAYVDSTATAVANNITVDLEAYTPDDAFVLADLTQFNYGDVNATSSVSAITVSNYENLGVLEGPLVNSVATAVGNNASFTVSSPDISVPSALD